MKGFYISIANGILEEKHQKKIGASIWQFLWCIDKVTKIDQDGDGWVLGGKPINLKDITGTHKVTVSRNLARLEVAGYIEMKHTPYGIIIKVKKAKKRFSNNANPDIEESVNKNVKPLDKTGLTKTLNPVSKMLNLRSNNVKPRFKNVNPNKTVSVDNSSKTIAVDINAVVAIATPTPKEYAQKFFDGIEKLMQKESVPWLVEFLQKLTEKTGASKSAIWREVREFGFWWTERNSVGTKAKWELQKTFEVEKRLRTWLNRVNILEANKSQPSKFSKGKGLITKESLKNQKING